MSRSFPARHASACSSRKRSWSIGLEEPACVEAHQTPYPFSVWAYHDHLPNDPLPPEEPRIWTPPAWVSATLLGGALLWWALAALSS